MLGFSATSEAPLSSLPYMSFGGQGVAIASSLATGYGSVIPGPRPQAFQVSPTESQILQTLRSFLLSILPPGMEVVKAQDNRVAEPQVSDFVVMTPIGRERLKTNEDSFEDVLMIGSISGNVLTITEVIYGQLGTGSVIFGIDVLDNTKIASFGTGSGGEGTYLVTQAQEVDSQNIAAGSKIFLQGTKITVQLDIHGPNSGNNAQLISTLFRDDYAIEQFATSPYDVVPCYADDPKQIPFTNDQTQVEFRWVVDAVMQANEVVNVPQQFADALSLKVISVEATYPS